MDMNNIDIRKNASGYPDPTAYEVMKKEEMEYKRFQKLLSTLFYICENAGFHIEERLVIKDIRTGRIWK